MSASCTPGRRNLLCALFDHAFHWQDADPQYLGNHPPFAWLTCRRCGADKLGPDGEPVLRIGAPSTRTRATPNCLRPPAGWSCSREPYHDGPCAARPTLRTTIGLWRRTGVWLYGRNPRPGAR